MSANPAWPTAGAPTTGPFPSDTLILLVNHYVRRLVIQYGDKPKAQQLIALFTKQMVVDDMGSALLHAFDLRTAQGPQLDVIGKYVGIARGIGTPVLPPFFSYQDYVGGNPQGTHGFALSTGNPQGDGGFFSYSQPFNPIDLTDAQYAFMIFLKIYINHFDGTLNYIQRFVAILQGLVTVVDNQNMSITYTIHPGVPVSQALLAAYLPKPIGIAINIVYA